MTSMMTSALGSGPAATVTAYVPDKHHFRGSFGGKDVIPLYRDSKGTPNVFVGTLEVIANAHTEHEPNAGEVSAEDLFAYCYAILAGTNYTQRFAEELQTAGPRVPLTAEPPLFRDAVELGKRLLWLHTFGERFGDEVGSQAIVRDDVTVVREIMNLPVNARAISYDLERQQLLIGGGAIGRVSPEVWSFEVSGMSVLKKWLGYRTAAPVGRAARSSSPLDRIRPESWLDDWTTELLEVVSVLQSTIELLPRGISLLDEILAGQLISPSALPPVPEHLRQVPIVVTLGNGGFGLQD
jgi:hypothetical protein